MEQRLCILSRQEVYNLVVAAALHGLSFEDLCLTIGALWWPLRRLFFILSVEIYGLDEALTTESASTILQD